MADLTIAHAHVLIYHQIIVTVSDEICFTKSTTTRSTWLTATSLFLYVVLKCCQLHNHDVVHDVAYITLQFTIRY